MFSEILIPHISQVYWFIIVSLIPNVSQVYGFIVVMLIPNVSQVYWFIIVRLIPNVSQVYGFIVMRLITHVSAGPSRGGRSGPNSGLPDLALMKKVLPRLIPLPGGKNPIIAQWARSPGQVMLHRKNSPNCCATVDLRDFYGEPTVAQQRRNVGSLLFRYSSAVAATVLL